MPHVTFLKGNNVVMRGTEQEDKQFVYCPDEAVPLVLDIVGTTPPNPQYFISRKCCDHFILFHVTEGKGYLEYNGKNYDLSPSDTILLSPGSRHRYYPDPADPFRIFWLNFFCDWLTPYMKGLQLEEKPVLGKISCAEQLLDLLNTAKETPDNNYLCYPTLHFICETVISLSERRQFEDREKRASSFAFKIKKLLNESIYGRTNLDEIAAKLYSSKSTVYREFEKHYGQSPYQYILNLKVERAKSLLCHTDYSVAEIAQKLSFADEFYFSNLFKRKTGYSPSAYRKQTFANIPPPRIGIIPLLLNSPLHGRGHGVGNESLFPCPFPASF